MRIIEKTFGWDKVLLPVIHTVSREQIVSSVNVAVDSGADGVFLIDQHIPAAVLLELLGFIRGECPGLKWLGINTLHFRPWMPLNVSTAVKYLDGIWSDSSSQEAQIGMSGARARVNWEGIWFGGAAFKYQPHVPTSDIPALVRTLGNVDVVVTTGEATGVAADLDKIQAFEASLVWQPLGIASGITPDNVNEYLPYVDAFLAATGIEESFGVLDAAKVRNLADKIHAYNPTAADVARQTKNHP